MDLCNDAHCDSLPVECTTEAHFGDLIWMDWVCSARMPTDFFVSRVAIKQLSVSVFPQAAVIPAFHRAYFTHSMENVETLHRIDLYRCIRLRVGYISQIFKQRGSKDGYLLREQWLLHVFLPCNESAAHAPRFCGPARLRSCIRSFKGGPQRT